MPNADNEYCFPSFQADENNIVEYVNKERWDEWKSAYRAWHRQVEENVRMLSGRHFDMYVDGLGRYVDISDWFAKGDDRWRQFPVYNWLLLYFKQTLSKLTENIPAIGAMPATADYKDAVLAEVVEPIWKYEWDQMDLPEQMFDLYGWVITAGRGILKQRWDPSRGPMEEFYAPTTLTLQDPITGAITERVIEQAPWLQMPDGSFQPHVLGETQPDGSVALNLDENGQPQFGPPHINYLGDMAGDVIAPTAVVTPFGPEHFMHKAWYTHEYLLPVDVARVRFDRPDLEPEDLTGEEDLLLKLQYGAHYGMPGSFFANVTSPAKQAIKDTVRVREHWQRQDPTNPDLAYGRLTVVSKTELLYDDINPYVVPGQQSRAIIPFYAFDLIKLPFKQEGTTDFEFLNPINRAIDRRMGALQDAVDFNEQPLTIVDENAGLQDQTDDFNRAGAVVFANMSVNKEPVKRLEAADLPRGSVQLLDIFREWLMSLGAVNEASEGKAVTEDASGELQREVRYDADRPWGATLRRHSYIWARVAQDMMDILSVTMEDERLLTISGQDNAWKFVMVRPEMFQGRVQIRPQPESAVLESRQDKQNRILNLATVMPGVIPPDQILSQLGYPDLVRLARPNHEAYSLACRENAEMAMGMPSPVLPEHDHLTHLLEHKKVQQTTEYRNWPDELKNVFRLHILFHEALLPQQAMHDAAVMAPVAASQAAVAGAGQPAQPADAGAPPQ